jgi:hypothetical protein
MEPAPNQPEENCVEILNKFKELFDYNADVARFIGRHGTIDR